MDTDWSELAERAEALSSAILAASGGDATMANAASMVGHGAAGVRRAMLRRAERTEREQTRAERRQAWDASEKQRTHEREYDEITKILADRRGISLAEAQKIRDDAAAESRRVAGLGSVDEQLSKLGGERDE